MKRPVWVAIASIAVLIALAFGIGRMLPARSDVVFSSLTAENLADFRERFNEGSERVRLVVLLSPT